MSFKSATSNLYVNSEPIILNSSTTGAVSFIMTSDTYNLPYKVTINNTGVLVSTKLFTVGSSITNMTAIYNNLASTVTFNWDSVTEDYLIRYTISRYNLNLGGVDRSEMNINATGAGDNYNIIDDEALEDATTVYVYSIIAIYMDGTQETLITPITVTT